MSQSLTDMLQYKQYYADAALLCLRRELPEAIARNTKFYLDPKVDDMSWVASMASTFAKRLVKSDVVRRTVESTSKKNIELYYMAPSRPVDYLLTFVGYYIPWFNQFIIKEKAAVRDVVTVENIKKDIVEHYHLLPMEGDGHEMRYHLMSWDGEYYDGSPTEWNDLKAIRDFLEVHGVYPDNDMWVSNLHKLFVRYRANKQAMAITSDRSKFNG